MARRTTAPPMENDEWKVITDEWTKWVKTNPKWKSEYDELLSIPSFIKRGTEMAAKRRRLATVIRICFEKAEVHDTPFYTPPPPPKEIGPCNKQDCGNTVYEGEEYEIEDYGSVCEECYEQHEQEEIREAVEEEEKLLKELEEVDEDWKHWPGLAPHPNMEDDHSEYEGKWKDGKKLGDDDD